MSNRIQSTGYVVLADKTIMPVSIDEEVFEYPSGTLTVTPLATDDRSKVFVKVVGGVDTQAAPAMTSILLDGNMVTGSLEPDGSQSLLLAAGTHVVSALYTDQNGAFADLDDIKVTIVHYAPPPPPPTHSVGSVGCSGGVIGEAAAIKKFNPPIMRSFSPGDAAGVHAAEGTKHISIVYSNDNAQHSGKTRGYDLIGVIDANDPKVTVWVKELETAYKNKDVQHFWICAHEEDIHGDDAVQLNKVYKGMRVVEKVMRSRGWDIKLVVCITGMPLEDSSVNGYQKYNLDEADVLGSDNYARKHWPELIAWGKKVGKPVCAPETGYKAQTNPTLYNDATQRSAMVADQQYWDQCLFVTYWIGGGNDLQNKPASTAYLAGACAAGPQKVTA